MIQLSHSVTPISSGPQCFRASGSIPMKHLFATSGQNIGASISVPVFPMNIQVWFLLGLTGLISLQSKGLSRVFSNLPYGPTLTFIHDYWKDHSLDYMDLCQQSDVSVFNMLSRFVIAFLPRSKCLLISWLHSPFAVIWEPKKIKSATVFTFSLSICHEVMELDVMIN